MSSVVTTFTQKWDEMWAKNYQPKMHDKPKRGSLQPNK